MDRFLVIVLLVLMANSVFSQGYAGKAIKVPVTARYAASKKVKQPHYRMQLVPFGDSIAVTAFGLQRLPRSMRKLVFPELNIKKNRSHMESSVLHSIDSVYNFVAAIKNDLSYPLANPANYKKQKGRFLSGAKASPYFTNQWIRISAVPNPKKDYFIVKTRGLFRNHHLYTYDYLSGAVAPELPALDPWHCEPANLQLFKLRKLQGFGPDKIKYIAYREIERMILRPSFEVYFSHNAITPDDAGLQKIVTYLEQNNYVILSATLEGGCSIEGDSVRNLFLQQKRAEVLQQTLHKYSDELIKKDTVTLADPMLQFRQLIRSTNLKQLDTLNNRQLIHLVNSDQNLRNLLESTFALQRKASLKLVVAKRLTRDEQFEKFRTDFIRITSKLTGSTQAKTEAESRTMGMIEKLLIYYEMGYVSTAQIDELINETLYPDYINVLLTYHFLKQYENQTWPRRVAASWAGYWEHHRVYEHLKQAQLSLITLCDFQPGDRKKYLNMLVDLQAYTYEFVENGLIPPSDLCEIPYPEKKEFMSLILNQYAYLYEVASKIESPDYFIHCVPTKSKTRIHNRDSIANTDNFLEQLDSAYGDNHESYTLIGQNLFRRKSFDQNQKGAYYFLLKQFYVNKNAGILDHVTTANDYPSSFNVFNLWHFLAITIDAWNPGKNFFYDKDVQLNEMDRLVNLMKKLDASLCKPQINGLYLQYHLKMLHYLQVFQEPGNPAHAKFADTSLKFIADYYKARKVNVNSRLAVYLVNQFNLFNTLPGNRPGAWYGYDLLNSLAQGRVLNDEELKLYAHYLRLFNPAFRKVPALYDQQVLSKLAEEKF
jgi:hypothetical protein